MKKIGFIMLLLLGNHFLLAQVMTPELLWKLNRISPIGLSNDGKDVIYASTAYSVETNSKSTSYYKVSIEKGETSAIDEYKTIFKDSKISPNGQLKIYDEEVKIKSVSGVDNYPELEKSNVQIYDNLNYRHWDTWEDGKYGHVFLKKIDSKEEERIDIMQGEAFDCPLKPFGGAEDYIWNLDGSKILYVAKKEYGTNYAKSTNTDIYSYDLRSNSTVNLTKDNLGYDTNPAFSKEGVLAWLQMDEPGYEADKKDIIVLIDGLKINLTKDWDGTVNSFLWSNDGKKIFFNAPVAGTIQLFEIFVAKTFTPVVKQITNGTFDVTGLIGQSDSKMAVTRTDMNHASEIYSVNLLNGTMTQLSHVNDEVYKNIKFSNIEKRWMPTTDGKKMLTWVIYPPDFDPTKKYPTLLYCQGGPQSALTQFYSFRWNFQLMAANGYIIVAPNRRGMPGYGVEWNEQISGDYGGQNIEDYLAAIDNVSKESYVDKNRIGCIGASYGGYSVYYLAGTHNNRFKSFIAHDGIFNTRSMYGTTEELFFVNKDLGGPYWDDANIKSYTSFNPIENVDKWNTPIFVIQGGKDYRVPIGQGLEAFQAAQLKGIKSKLMYLPDENHWVLSPQNGIVWQNEFFKWLTETLN